MDLKAFIKTASAKFPKFTPRQRRLYALRRVLHGELYEDRAYAFSQEQEQEWSGERISLDRRRPSVEYNLMDIAVGDQVSMLFGEEHRPSIIVRDDDNTSDWITAFVEDTKLWWHMNQAAYEGSVGTAVFVTRVLAPDEPGPDGKEKPGRFYHELWDAEECNPQFKREAPDVLKSLERIYYVSDDALRADQFDVDALRKKWINKDGRTKSAKLARLEEQQILNGDVSLPWVRRIVLDENEEKVFEPIPRFIYEASDFKMSEWPQDTERSYAHNLGETPALWILNAPANGKLHPDGDCLVKSAVNFQLRIDRTLSQTGRAFDYCGDPQAWRATGQQPGMNFGEDDTPSDGTASGEIEVPEKGGAGFIEIKGEGLKVAIESYIGQLKSTGKEAVGASRIDPETTRQGVLTGSAMKMLNSNLIQCVGVLRLSYGDNGVVPILKLGMRIAAKVNVELPSLKELIARRQREDDRRAQVKSVVKTAADEIGDKTIQPPEGCGCCDKCGDSCGGDQTCCAECKRADEAPSYTGEPNPECLIELNWPAYYEPTGQDFAQQITGIVTAVTGGVISKETGVANAGSLFDVVDSTKELDRIQDEQSVTRAQATTDAKNETNAAAEAKAKHAPAA